MAEIDLAAKRHATAGRRGQGLGQGGGERDGFGVEDMTDQAEQQVRGGILGEIIHFASSAAAPGVHAFAGFM